MTSAIEVMAKSESGLEYGYKVTYEDGFVVRVMFMEPVTDEWVMKQADERKQIRLRSFSKEENIKRGYYESKEASN